MAERNEEQTVKGTVENVVFSNPANHFTVIELSVAGGELITAVGVLADIAAGEEVTLRGAWDSHSVFGRQFRVG